MKIVGCDLHTRYQQIAMLDEETGELTECRLERSLLVEAAQIAVRCDPGMRKQYLHRCHQKAKGVGR